MAIMAGFIPYKRLDLQVVARSLYKAKQRFLLAYGRNYETEACDQSLHPALS
jgi:hypothetical protein